MSARGWLRRQFVGERGKLHCPRFGGGRSTRGAASSSVRRALATRRRRARVGSTRRRRGSRPAARGSRPAARGSREPRFRWRLRNFDGLLHLRCRLSSADEGAGGGSTGGPPASRRSTPGESRRRGGLFRRRGEEPAVGGEAGRTSGREPTAAGSLVARESPRGRLRLDPAAGSSRHTREYRWLRAPLPANASSCQFSNTPNEGASRRPIAHCFGGQSVDLGAQNGGFRTACNGDKTCVRNRCMTVFGNNPTISRAATGSGWFDAADNPKLTAKQIACPAAITSGPG